MQDFLIPVLESLAQPVVVVNERREVILINPAAKDLFAKALEGSTDLITCQNLFGCADFSGCLQAKKGCPALRVLEEGKPYVPARIVLQREGEELVLEGSCSPLSSPQGGRYVVFVLYDVTEVEKRAATDPLTQLANRRRFEEVLEIELERVRRYGTYLGLALVDVDNFKEINDTYGHEAGDKALRILGEILKRNCRACDIPARIGGDEFAIIMPNTTPRGAQRAVERIREALNNLNKQRQLPFTLEVSIGLSNSGISLDDLVSLADTAMYAEKQQRKQLRKAQRE